MKGRIVIGLFLSSLFFVVGGDAQTDRTEKPALSVMIQATSEQIKKAAMVMLARNWYTVDSDTSTQLKISKPFGDDETAAYNTAHWTSEPVANCRHVQTFLLSPKDEGTSVTLTTEMVCHTDGMWLIRRDDDKKRNSVGTEHSG